jgi:hypothetical protein
LSNQGLYKPPSMVGWLGCEVLKIIELIIFNTSQPSHPNIEGGLYSPWFDEPVIELIIFNTSQPSHPTIEEDYEFYHWFVKPRAT